MTAGALFRLGKARKLCDHFHDVPRLPTPTHAVALALSSATSGHGSCSNYVCTCFVGFFGDDCRHTFAPDSEAVIPILGAGDYNLTTKNFSKAVKRERLMIVGFSSRKCHK